jgi:hypothetical protein
LQTVFQEWIQHLRLCSESSGEYVEWTPQNYIFTFAIISTGDESPGQYRTRCILVVGTNKLVCVEWMMEQCKYDWWEWNGSLQILVIETKGTITHFRADSVFNFDKWSNLRGGITSIRFSEIINPRLNFNFNFNLNLKRLRFTSHSLWHSISQSHQLINQCCQECFGCRILDMNLLSNVHCSIFNVQCSCRFTESVLHFSMTVTVESSGIPEFDCIRASNSSQECCDDRDGAGWNGRDWFDLKAIEFWEVRLSDHHNDDEEICCHTFGSDHVVERGIITTAVTRRYDIESLELEFSEKGNSLYQRNETGNTM